MLGLKPPQLRGEIFHSQDSHKPPAQAKQLIKSPYICVFTKESTLSLKNNHENIDDFNKICTGCVVFSFWFVWSDVGTRDRLLEGRREAQLLRWGHFSDSWSGLRLFPPMVGVGEGILGSCTEKTSAPDEANPAGACLSVHSRAALPPSGSHAHIHPALSWPVELKEQMFQSGETPTTVERSTELRLQLKCYKSRNNLMQFLCKMLSVHRGLILFSVKTRKVSGKHSILVLM